MFSKTKKFILPLVIVLVVFAPLGVFAAYKCECTNLGFSKTYNTEDECENVMFANSCTNYCVAHGGGGDCSFIDSQSGTSNTQTGTSNTQTGGRTETPSAELDNPLQNNEVSIPNIIAKIIKIILGLTGVASLVMFIYAGFLWLTAQGSMEKVKKGRDTMLYAVIGIVVVFSSYIILNYLFGILTF